MATVTSLYSEIIALILACLTKACPPTTPATISPMITITIDSSIRVKPLEFDLTNPNIV
jgi:hypothetical protein